MRYSRYLLPTLREDPQEAEIISHKLMIRSGMIRKVASGIYELLPFGLKAMRKVEKVIREEMERIGAQEVLLPVVIPAELWKESGRWEEYGKELLRFKDRHDRDFCLGPTHEEVVTDLVRREVRSYRQLPLCLFQIQVKFRDEIRPRFGVMRAREFVMKDAYSFDADQKGLDESYSRMYEAYQRIFRRLGLDFRVVEADTGLIGGESSHEFMVLASTGEDIIVTCNACSYSANIELAQRRKGDSPRRGTPAQSPKTIKTPGMRSVEEVSSFLGVEPSKLIKTLILQTDQGPIAALIRGDHELSETKLKRLLNLKRVELCDEETILSLTGGPRGFSGPIGLPLKKIADWDLEGAEGMVVGGNQEDLHIVGVSVGRDFEVDLFADIRKVVPGDPCPNCEKGELQLHRGIEVGHIFKLGTKYSKAMRATFLDREGKEKPFEMGCYGIGVGRTVAACIEQHHDEDGMIFPMSMAPFQIYLLPINLDDPKIRETSENLYGAFSENGIEVLYDDRQERPGVKFKDADLLGIPIRITIGEKGLKEGKVEFRIRKTKETFMVKVSEALERAKEMIEEELKRLEG
jgi:prolyl-tRNA synthetase